MQREYHPPYATGASRYQKRRAFVREMVVKGHGMTQEMIQVTTADLCYVVRKDLIACLFDVPTVDAARLLRVCVTLLKRIRSLCGLAVWPYAAVCSGTYRLNADDVYLLRASVIRRFKDMRVYGRDRVFLDILEEAHEFVGRMRRTAELGVASGPLGGSGAAAEGVAAESAAAESAASESAEPPPRKRRRKIAWAVIKTSGAAAPPADLSVDMAVEKYVDWSGEKYAAQSVEFSTAPSVEKSVDFSVEKSVAASVEKSVDFSVEKSVAAPVEVSTAPPVTRPPIDPLHYLVPWGGGGESGLGRTHFEPIQEQGVLWTPAMYDPAKVYALERLECYLLPSKRGPPQPWPEAAPDAPGEAWCVAEGFLKE